MNVIVSVFGIISIKIEFATGTFDIQEVKDYIYKFGRNTSF